MCFIECHYCCSAGQNYGLALLFFLVAALLINLSPLVSAAVACIYPLALFMYCCIHPDPSVTHAISIAEELHTYRTQDFVSRCSLSLFLFFFFFSCFLFVTHFLVALEQALCGICSELKMSCPR